jgi:hypothetical protein
MYAGYVKLMPWVLIEKNKKACNQFRFTGIETI